MHWADDRKIVRDEIKAALKEYRGGGEVITQVRSEDQRIADWKAVD